MTVKIQKWGNSLAVRIPKRIASEVQLVEGSEVELSDIDGKIIVEPRQSVPSFEELVSKITKENRHEEMDFGPARGKEIW